MNAVSNPVEADFMDFNNEIKTNIIGDTMLFSIFKPKEKVLVKNGCEWREPSDFCFEDFTYTFTTKPFDLQSIDGEASKLFGQNRLNGKLSPDFVRQYGMAMEQGDVFPALAIDCVDGKKILRDGFHTLKAAEGLGIKKAIGVYMYSHPNTQDVAARFNARTTGNGEPLSERVEKAVNLYMAKEAQAEAEGKTLDTRKEWSRGFLIEPETFNWHYRRLQTRRFLSKRGVDVDAIQDGGCFESIFKVMKTDQASAVQIAKLAALYALRDKEVREIVDHFMDPQYDVTEKQVILQNHMKRLKNSTNNGTSISKTRPRSPENIYKADLMKLAERCKRLDIDKLRGMLADDNLKNAITEKLKFLNMLLGNKQK